MVRYIYLLIFIYIQVIANAQIIQGSIVDSDNRSVPYSTVFVKELSFGTAANEDGRFEIRLPEGYYTFVFQCMGYQTVTKQLTVGKDNKPLQITLPDMVYSLNAVEVSDGGEDPAYRIMRRVIRKAPLYATMVKSFNAEVYIRGSLHIKKISAMIKWMAKDDLKESDIREGDTYLEESVNEIDFTAPDKTRQNVKSIHSTFPGGNQDKSSAAIGFISGNIYSPNAFGNARSPLSAGAFRYYRYRYEGVNTYGNVVVDKIRVLPKGDGPQYVSGYLYIIEGLWCIYSVDLKINEQLGFDIQLSQSFGEVREGAWLPVSNQYKIDMDLMGNAGGFVYNTSIRYNNLVVNPPDPIAAKPATSQGEPKDKRQERTLTRTKRLEKKASELLAKDNPTDAEASRAAKVINRKSELQRRDSLRVNHEFVENYKVVMDSNARTSDSAFWNRVRPIPLAVNERLSVKTYDSVQYRNKHPDTDSLKTRKHPGTRLHSVLLTGGLYKPDTLQSLHCDGILNPFGLSFNTVDGFVYKIGFEYHRKTGRNAELFAGFKPGYAFSRKAFLWDATLGFRGKGRFKNSLALKSGSGSFDFNGEGGAASIENSISSLFFRQNLVRLYGMNYLEIQHHIEPAFGWNLETKLFIKDVQVLENHSDYSFFYRDERSYKPNVPENPDYSMSAHSGAGFNLVVSYKPMPYYVIKNGIKVPRPGMNRTPTLWLGWKKAIPFSNFESDFDMLTFGIKQQIKAGTEAVFNYSISAGWFVQSRSVWFDEFYHVQVQPLVFGIKAFFPVMQTGNYYQYSTSSGFAEAHGIYTTPRLLLKRLPLIRSRMWNESLLLNYIYVPAVKNTIEAGYGIGNYVYEFGVFAGFDKNGFNAVNLRVSLLLFSKGEIRVGM